eukprot:331668-Prymnesium_polylepis.4
MLPTMLEDNNGSGSYHACERPDNKDSIIGDAPIAVSAPGSATSEHACSCRRIRAVGAAGTVTPVSYTHLTLPTICSV